MEFQTIILESEEYISEELADAINEAITIKVEDALASVLSDYFESNYYCEVSCILENGIELQHNVIESKDNHDGIPPKGYYFGDKIKVLHQLQTILNKSGIRLTLKDIYSV